MKKPLESQVEFALHVMRMSKSPCMHSITNHGSEFVHGYSRALRFAISLLDENGPEAKEIEAELERIAGRTA